MANGMHVMLGFLAIFLLVGIIVVAAGGDRAAVSAPSAPGISGVTQMPAFITNVKEEGRDGGISAGVGGKVLWEFGDTFSPSGLRSATAAWASLETPWVLSEEADENDSPLQFLPFTPEEIEFNRNHSNPMLCCYDHDNCATNYCHCPPSTDCRQRIAMWPGDCFALNATAAVCLYESLYVGYASFDFTQIGVGTAIVTVGSTVASRVLDATGSPVYQFGPSDLTYTEGVRGNDGYVYLYGPSNQPDCGTWVYAARVPLGSLGSREAYAFWDPKNEKWEADMSKAKPASEEAIGSVIWSDYLGQYLAMDLGMCTGGNSATFRVASAPQGPWSAITKVNFTSVGAESGSYAGELHEELAVGNTVVASFYHPDDGYYFQVGSIYLARVELTK